MSASERTKNDQVSDYGSECKVSDGCTCAAKQVYKSTPRECILVQSTSAVEKNVDPFGKASCNRTYKFAAYDCEWCQNFVLHTDRGMVLNGRNRETTDILRLNNGVTVTGFFLIGSYTCDWCIRITDFIWKGTAFLHLTAILAALNVVVVAPQAIACISFKNVRPLFERRY